MKRILALGLAPALLIIIILSLLSVGHLLYQSEAPLLTDKNIRIAYYGTNEFEFEEFCLNNDINCLIYEDDCNESFANMNIIIDIPEHELNIETIKNLLKTNSLYFPKILSTKFISERILEVKSYETLVSSSDGLKQLVKVYVDNDTYKIDIIGYYDNGYYDLISKIISSTN